MSDEGLALETVRQMAQGIGLTKLAPEHMQQLQRAMEAARSRQGALRFGALTPSDEPSNVYRLPLE